MMGAGQDSLPFFRHLLSRRSWLLNRQGADHVALGHHGAFKAA
jgi:hypothetical protein